MFRISFFTLFFLSLVTANLFATPTLNLSQYHQDYSLAGKVEYLVDWSNKLTFEEARTQKNEFIPAISDTLSFGYSQASYWVHFKMKNTAAEKKMVMVTLSYPILDQVTFYAIDTKTDRILETVETGDQYPFSQRALIHRNFIFPLTMVAGQDIAIYFKVKTSSSVIIPLTVSDQQQFLFSDSTMQILFGLYYGIILVMICYNFSLYLSLREQSYLYYILFHASWGFVQLGLNGLSFQYLWPTMPGLNKMSLLIAIELSSVFSILFTQHFLNTKEQVPRFDKALRVLLFASFSTSATAFLLPGVLSQLIFLANMLLIAVVIFLSAVMSYRKGYQPALYFLIAWALVIPGFIISVLKPLGIIPHVFITEYAGQIGSAIEVVLLSLGLVDKINVIKKEKEEAQNQVIETQRKAQNELIEKNKIIEQKNKDLKVLNSLKDDFLANTSHELRTPLNGIIGLSQSLIEEKKGKLPQLVVQDLKLIINSGKRLFLLINDILDIVRLEHKDLRIEKKSLNLYEVVDSCVKIQDPWFQEKGLQWKNLIPRDIAVQADPDRLQQIVQNLLSNALKFTFDGEISISVTKKEKFAEISVQDSGIGISKKNQKRIFDRFEREKRERHGGGIGLGLSIVRSLVEKHGGTIAVESKIDHGSRFHFTLPLSDQPVEPMVQSIPVASIHASRPAVSALSWQKRGMPPVSPSPDRSGYKVLIVDDDPINLTSLINQLNIGEFFLQKASNGKEALKLIQQDKPDIILMDIMMDQLSGIEACRQIRKKYGKLELPIIFQTCRDRDIDLKEALEAGGNDYITKPFSSVEIISRIHNHLKIAKESQQIPKPILKIISQINEIVYIRSSHDYACLYGYDNRNSLGEHYITLEKIIDYLGEQLIRVNRSTLVKASEIKSLRSGNRKTFIQFKGIFATDFECNLTKGNRSVFKEKFPNLL